METHRGMPTDLKIKRLKELFYEHQPYQVICDKSNVGEHICNKLLMEGVPAIAQTFGSVSRGQMLSVLSIVSNNRRLIIPYKKGNYEVQFLADKLVEQLSGLREEKSQKGNKLIASKAPHDDIAMSLALAVKGAEEQDTDIGGFGNGS